MLLQKKTEVPSGERGELWLKGPNIMKVRQSVF